MQQGIVFSEFVLGWGENSLSKLWGFKLIMYVYGKHTAHQDRQARFVLGIKISSPVREMWPCWCQMSHCGDSCAPSWHSHPDSSWGCQTEPAGPSMDIRYQPAPGDPAWVCCWWSSAERVRKHFVSSFLLSYCYYFQVLASTSVHFSSEQVLEIWLSFQSKVTAQLKSLNASPRTQLTSGLEVLGVPPFCRILIVSK